MKSLTHVRDIIVSVGWAALLTLTVWGMSQSLSASDDTVPKPARAPASQSVNN